MDDDLSLSPDLLARMRAAVEAGQAPTESIAPDVDNLLASHRERVLRLCLRLTGNRETAQELAQEVMLVAWTRLPEYEPRAPFSAWLYGIARNLCLNRLARRHELLTEDGVIDEGDPALPALALLTRTEREALMTRSFAGLDPTEQEAAWLRYVDGLPRENIEAVLGLPSGQARVLLQRCRRHLRQEVRAHLALLGQGSSFLRTSS